MSFYFDLSSLLEKGRSSLTEHVLRRPLVYFFFFLIMKPLLLVLLSHRHRRHYCCRLYHWYLYTPTEAREQNHLELCKILVYFAKRQKGLGQNLYSLSFHRDYFSPRGHPHSPVPSPAVPSGQNVFILAAGKEHASWDIPIAAICSA